jgi:hypothetical protein
MREGSKAIAAAQQLLQAAPAPARASLYIPAALDHWHARLSHLCGSISPTLCRRTSCHLPHFFLSHHSARKK